MNLIVISDIDDLHWKGPAGKADVLIACGDVFDSVILEAAVAFNAAKIFAIRGNHDSPIPFPSPIRDLHLKVEKYGGVSFGGLNGSWKYKDKGNFLYTQDQVSQMLDTFPPVDILITHNSPRKIHDRNDDIHIGFDALNTYLLRNHPKLIIHGHQHTNTESYIEGTKIIGVYGFRVLQIADSYQYENTGDSHP